jgi:hypothetical protein
VLTRWVSCFEAVKTSVAPIRVTTPQVSYQGKTWLQSEVLLAPLGQGGQILMLLAAVDTWPAAQA